MQFQESIIEGLHDQTFAWLMEDTEFKREYEYGGMMSALRYFMYSDLYAMVDLLELSVPVLQSWGLRKDIAEEIVAANPSEHLGLRRAIVAALCQPYGYCLGWHVRTASGWPADRPIDRVFMDNPSDLIQEAKQLPKDNLPKDVRFLFTESLDRGYLTSMLPKKKGRTLIFHGTSWKFIASLYRGVNVDTNVDGKHDFGTGFYGTDDLGYGTWWPVQRLNPNSGISPAVCVFSIEEDFRWTCKAVQIDGQKWTDTLVHFRKENRVQNWSPIELPESVRTADVVEGPICRNVAVTNACRAMPVETSVNQLCFKTNRIAQRLKLEMVIVFKQNTTLPSDFPHPY